jgi:hypothetical protein
MRGDLRLYTGGEDNFCRRFLTDGSLTPFGNPFDRRRLRALNVEPVLSEAPIVIEGQAFTTGAVPRVSLEHVLPNTLVAYGVKDGLSASDEVTAATLDNTGSIVLTGSSADEALLAVAGGVGFGTTGVLSGYIRLVGDSAIEFGSGEITSLAAHAHLGLNGSGAFIEDSTALGSNSALTGLASIGAGAIRRDQY